jgi:signal transduction histidine kinase
MAEHEFRDKGVIICVDDQPAVLHSLMIQLESAVGDICEIETTESAEEALELMKELHENGERIEMIISDEVMPGMQGSQFLELAHQRFPDSIKIMLTGQAGLDAVAYAINHAGLDRYFPKPWEYEDLQLTIKGLLEKGRFARHNKKLTRELQEHYKELERTYKELSLAYKQLKDLQEQLIHAEKLSLVGQLSGRIAHEIKNQLNMINFAELIQAAYPHDAKVQDYTKYILEAGRNIYNLVEEIRQFAKKEPRSYAMSPSSVTDLIENVLNFLRFDQLLVKRKIIRDFHDSPVIPLNQDKLTQVIINLVQNAAHATSEDNGEISIGVATNEHHVLIEIQDNGCGIPEEHLEQIWEPFFTTKGEKGTGLGLDICKRIVEEHHGTISCTSQVDDGTTFCIALPLNRDTSDAMR